VILFHSAEVVAGKMLANPDMKVLWDDIMSLSTTELVDSFGIPLIKVGSLKKVIRTEFQQHQSFTDMTGDTSIVEILYIYLHNLYYKYKFIPNLCFYSNFSMSTFQLQLGLCEMLCREKS